MYTFARYKFDVFKHDVMVEGETYDGAYLFLYKFLKSSNSYCFLYTLYGTKNEKSKYLFKKTICVYKLVNPSRNNKSQNLAK